MDWLYALLALGVVALPLAGVWWLLGRQHQRSARGRIGRSKAR